jgi:DNA polymerase III delta prime subunit
MVADRFVRNTLLYGPVGTGKTSTTRAICNQLGADVFSVNGCLQKGIADLRSGVVEFAISGNVYGRPKVVVIDEADGLTQDYQAALRGVIDKTVTNCGFVLVTNTPSAISTALHSRCLALDFHPRPDEEPAVRQGYLDRIHTILRAEEASCTNDQIVEVFRSFPDFRQMLIQLQNECGR